MLQMRTPKSTPGIARDQAPETGRWSAAVALRQTSTVDFGIGSGLAQIVQERSRRFEVARVEPFGKPIVDRPEKGFGLSRLALIAQHPRKCRPLYLATVRV
jgi:hypothetical protein